MKRLQLIVWAFAAMAIVSQGNAQTLVVSQDGGGDYTTINAAVTAANTGDTILVRPGRYRENIVLSKRLTLIGEDLSAELIRTLVNEDVIEFRNGSGGSVLRGFIIRDGSEIHIRNWNPKTEEDRIHILNNHFFDSRLIVRGVSLIANNTFDSSTGRSNHILIAEGGQSNTPLIVANNVLNGGNLQLTGSYVNIINNQISDFRHSSPDPGAISIGIRDNERSYDIKVIANRIENSRNGILWEFKDYGEVFLQGFLTANNTIINCDYGIHLFFYNSGGNEIYAEGTIINNVVYNSSGQTSIYPAISGTTDIGSSRVRVFNNIFTNASSGSNVFTNSIWQNNSFSEERFIPIEGYGVLESRDNIFGDPLFTDPDNGDFTLQNGSPCIDAGINKGAYSDIDLTRNDMGVYGGSLTQGNFAVTDPNAPKFFLLGQPYQSILKGYHLKLKAIGIAQ